MSYVNWLHYFFGLFIINREFYLYRNFSIIKIKERKTEDYNIQISDNNI